MYGYRLQNISILNHGNSAIRQFGNSLSRCAYAPAPKSNSTQQIVLWFDFFFLLLCWVDPLPGQTLTAWNPPAHTHTHTHRGRERSLRVEDSELSALVLNSRLIVSIQHASLWW